MKLQFWVGRAPVLSTAWNATLKLIGWVPLQLRIMVIEFWSNAKNVSREIKE